MKEVLYKGLLLQRGSKAYELYHDTKDPDAKKKLEKHIKEVLQQYKELTK